MKGFGSVLKLLIKNMFKRSKSERRNVRIFTGIALAVVYVFLMVSLITSAVSLAPAVREAGCAADVITMLFTLAVLVMLFFGIPMILSWLYFSRDTEFFLSLPISSSTVYFAKITMIYLSMLVVEAALLLPTLIVFGALVGMNALYYVIMLIGVAFLPVVPLVLASIIAMPLMFVVGAFKNRGALSSIVMIVMFLLFFGGYYALIYALGFGGATGGEETGAVDFTQILLDNKDALRLMSDILLPLSSIARLATLTPVYGLGVGLSALANAGIYVGITAALLAVALLASSSFYKHSVMVMLEGSRGKDNKAREFKASGGVVKALIGKEWKQLVRTPQFALNSFLSVFMPVIIIVFMNLTMNSSLPDADETTKQIVRSMFAIIDVIMIMMIGVGLNMGASTCITREGEAFAFSKSLPVDATTHIKAKRILYLGISYASVALGLIAAVIFAPDWSLLSGLLLLIPYNYIFVTLAIYLDLTSPNLKWTTPQEAMKRNVRGMVPFLINMFVSMVIMAVLLVTRMLLVDCPEEYLLTFTLIHFGAWIVLIGVSVVVAVLMHGMLKVRAAKLYDRLEV